MTPKRGEEKYYKSQKEVDAAFKKRLDRERKKWEESLKNVQYPENEKKETDERTVLDELNNIGSELEPFLKYIENEEGFEKIREENEEDKKAEEFAASVLDEVEKLEELYDDLDLSQDFNNSLFTYMLEKGEPLKKVYDYFNPQKNYDALHREIEREIIGQIRARNSKPNSISHANASSAYYDASRLTQKDIEEIDRRVKRGERNCAVGIKFKGEYICHKI